MLKESKDIKYFSGYPLNRTKNLESLFLILKI